ncbi:unnamed protein product [Hydatigera taeniaeformis]|uniref:Zinc finger protein n=1 Tax=Hydatigena taeniaeformis TaxID=6205 RepID=A0A0R3WI81_HYDTA|nr:unnamed protein product [Hydatigera taeniaeformis]
MLSLTTKASNETMHVNSDPIDKVDPEMYASSHSLTDGDDKLKRPSKSPSPAKGQTKTPRVQAFQPLKCRCERSFIGIAEFVLHAQTCPDLMHSSENAVDLSSQSPKPIRTELPKGLPPPTNDALDLTVRGIESTTAGLNTTNPTLTCPECKVNTVSHMQLLRHFEQAHGIYGNYACFCGVEFGWLPAFLSHHLLCPTVTSKKPQNAGFEGNFSKKHIPLQIKQAKPTLVSIQPQPDLSRPFKCCHCVKSFKSKALLDQHMHIHYPPKYTCRYCAKKYRWPPVFYHHQRTCKKRPSTAAVGATTNNSSIGRSNEPTQTRGYGPRVPQSSTFQFPIPPTPPPVSVPALFLLHSPTQELRPPIPSALLLPPPPPPLPAFGRSWERKEAGSLINMASLRLPPFPLPLGANPDNLRFPAPPPLPLPPPPLILPFYSALESHISNVCVENGSLNETSSPVTCMCGRVFESLSPYLSHIAACPLFGRALSIPPPSLEEANSTMFLANMISVLEKCKPEFFQQFLNRNSPQSEAQDSGSNLCDQCGKEFSSRLSLKQHVEGKHSTEGKYQCPGCAKRYRWGASYYYHKKSCPAVCREDEENFVEDELCSSPSNAANVNENSMCAVMLFQSAAELLEQQQHSNQSQVAPVHKQHQFPPHEHQREALTVHDSAEYDRNRIMMKANTKQDSEGNVVSIELRFISLSLE